jgi:hypothetical protein
LLFARMDVRPFAGQDRATWLATIDVNGGTTLV